MCPWISADNHPIRCKSKYPTERTGNAVQFGRVFLHISFFIGFAAAGIALGSSHTPI